MYLMFPKNGKDGVDISWMTCTDHVLTQLCFASRAFTKAYMCTEITSSFQVLHPFDYRSFKIHERHQWLPAPHLFFGETDTLVTSALRMKRTRTKTDQEGRCTFQLLIESYDNMLAIKLLISCLFELFSVYSFWELSVCWRLWPQELMRGEMLLAWWHWQSHISSNLTSHFVHASA